MWEFVTYRPLVWLIAIVVLVVVAARYSLVDRPPLLRWLSVAFRTLAILLLILALCRPFASRENQALHVNFLVDVSESVDLTKASQSLDQIALWQKSLRSGDTWSLFMIGDGVRRFGSIEALRSELDGWQQGVGNDKFRSHSRIAEALLTTRLFYPAGKARRAVLLSDGHETKDELTTTLAQLAAEDIDVRFWPTPGLAESEAAVLAIEPSSPEAFYGEVLRITVKLATNQQMAGKLRLIHKGVAVQQQDVMLDPSGRNIFHFDVDMKTPGASHWSAELVSARDHFPINNTASATINVRGRPRVLVLHQKPQVLRSLSRMLEEQEMTVEVRGQYGLPETLEEIASFDAVVLADLPATSLTVRQMQMLKRYVTDLGGGLLMTGSENSFGLGGYYKTPVEDVLPLVSRFEKEKEKPSLAMVLVIDKSGSMDGVPIELARQAAKAAVELLSPRDSIAVVGFDHEAQVICEMSSAADSVAVQAAIDSLMAGGGTFMYPAMVVAKDMLDSTPAKIRHMICLGDGMTQSADHESLAEEMRDAGITVSTVALGQADKQLMAAIAELGGGRYYETNDPMNVPQIFTKETMEATKSAIKEDLYSCVQTGDHPILAGYNDAELPFTLGYVMTEAKATAQLLLAVETGDPLLAVGRYGLGAGMAYTSDLTDKWGGEWLAWEGCGRFWAQAIRGILRNNSTDGMQIVSHTDEEFWRFNIRRVADNGQPLNDTHWDAAAFDENQQEQPIEVHEVGLGRYEARVPIAGREHITVRLRDADHDKTSLQHFNKPYPSEYRLAQDIPMELANLPPLSRETVVEGILPHMVEHSVAHYAYWGALGCLILSVLLRRV